MSKLLERLDELLEAASIAEGSDESEYHWNNYVFALNAAHPKLKAVVEAAKRACDAHSWGGIPHEQALELEDALSALDESSPNQSKD